MTEQDVLGEVNKHFGPLYKSLKGLRSYLDTIKGELSEECYTQLDKEYEKLRGQIQDLHNLAFGFLSFQKNPLGLKHL